MKQIQIVGGGLAGLTLGIGLRQKGVPVTVWEAGHYPRHRVCGEFISGQGQEVLARLGLLPLILEWKPRLARTAAFFTEHHGSRVRPLPQPALCIERYLLDHVFAKKICALGGELREGQRWPEKAFPEGVVCTAGRRTQAVDRGWRWFGLKAHFQNVPMLADLEIHLQPGGYVGLCRLNDGRVNVCGLFRQQAGRTVPVSRSPEERLRGPPGSLLRERMTEAEMDENSFCAVAGLSLRPQRASVSECRIGDALTMISPISGNGMSMAFESAALAMQLIADYSAGRLSWPETLTLLAKQCDGAFQRRLAWAWQLQRALFQPILPAVLLRLISKSDWLWRKFFEMTRR